MPREVLKQSFLAALIDTATATTMTKDKTNPTLKGIPQGNMVNLESGVTSWAF
jgi:hypothetical protein